MATQLPGATRTPDPVWAFFLGLSSLITIKLVGDLFVSEIILLILLVHLLLTGDLWIRSRAAYVLLIFGAAWLLAQFGSDQLNDIPISDRLRGVARIGLFLITLLVLQSELVTVRGLLLLTLGVGLSLGLRPIIDMQPGQDLAFLWKFGLGQGIFILAVAIACLRYDASRIPSSPHVGLAAIAIALAVLSFYLNSRSLAALLLLTGFLVLYAKRMQGKRSRSGSLAGFFIVIGIASAIISSTYQTLVIGGVFGETALTKYQEQTGGRQLGPIDFLLSGRSEFLVSTEAIKDAPLFGHGSWAKDYKYTFLLIDLQKARLQDSSIGDGDFSRLDGLIPSHSYLLGAWVEAGLIGAIFWLLAGWFIIFRAFPASLFLGGSTGLLAISLLPFQIWAILFSPFGGPSRLVFASALVVFLFVSSRAKLAETYQ